MGAVASYADLCEFWVQHKRKAAVYEDYQQYAGKWHRTVVDNVFWKKIKELVGYKEHNHRIGIGGESFLKPFVQFDSLDACKQKFRNTMNDDKWRFTTPTSAARRNDVIVDENEYGRGGAQTINLLFV